MAELVGERAEAARGMRVRLFGEAEMGDRISLQAVRTALKQDEFGAPLAQKCLRAVPSLEESGIVSTRWERHVELRTARSARAGLVGGTRARVEIAAILMEIDEDEGRVRLERIEDAIAMMRVDIDVGDRAQSVLAPQDLDCDTAIVEHAEARGPIARCVMEPCNRNECALRPIRHERIDADERRTDDAERGLEDAALRRRVAAVQEALPRRGTFANEFDVLRRVESL